MNFLMITNSMETSALIESLLETAFEEVPLLTRLSPEMDYTRTESLESIDLIILDMSMEEINPKKVIDQLAVNKQSGQIPFLVLVNDFQREKLKILDNLNLIEYLQIPLKKEELIIRLNVLLKIAGRIKEHYAVKSELDLLKNELRNIPTTDNLTGLANRLYFNVYLDKEWNRALRYTRPLSMLLIDLDFFRLYNEKYGSEEAGRSLERLAKAIKSETMRSADLSSRFADKVYSVLLPETDSNGAGLTAERVRTGITALKIENSESPISKFITASIGVATITPKQDRTPESIIEACETALKNAKSLGRNRISVFKSYKYRD